MLAGRAYPRCLGSLADIPAVAALPPYFAVAPEEVAVRKAAQQLEVAFLVMRFDGRNHAERRGHFRETLFLGDAAKIAVQNVPLLTLAVGRGQQILLRGSDGSGGVSRRNFDVAALQKLEEALGVFLLDRKSVV